jgi:hypothetical protein
VPASRATRRHNRSRLIPCFISFELKLSSRPTGFPVDHAILDQQIDAVLAEALAFVKSWQA